VLGVTHREQRHDAALTQTFANNLRVITTVAYYAVRPIASALPHSLQRWDGINGRERLPRVITVGSGDLDN
jgi:hypothetical protein